MVYITTAVLLLAQLADWYTTKKFMSVGVEEGNPVVKWLLDRFGFNGFLVVKVFVTLLVALSVISNDDAVGHTIGWLFAVLLFAVAFRNWRIYKRSSK